MRGGVMSASTEARPDATGGPCERVEIVIEGMTCASCATRIEERLNKLEAVHRFTRSR